MQAKKRGQKKKTTRGGLSAHALLGLLLLVVLLLVLLLALLRRAALPEPVRQPVPRRQVLPVLIDMHTRAKKLGFAKTKSDMTLDMIPINCGMRGKMTTIMTQLCDDYQLMIRHHEQQT